MSPVRVLGLFRTSMPSKFVNRRIFRYRTLKISFRCGTRLMLLLVTFKLLKLILLSSGNGRFRRSRVLMVGHIVLMGSTVLLKFVRKIRVFLLTIRRKRVRGLLVVMVGFMILVTVVRTMLRLVGVMLMRRRRTWRRILIWVVKR